MVNLEDLESKVTEIIQQAKYPEFVINLANGNYDNFESAKNAITISK